MLRHCTLNIVRSGEVKHCEHCYIKEVQAGAQIIGDHNTILNGDGFSGSGDHNHFSNCKNVTWSGDHCTIMSNSSRFTLSGDYTYMNGHDCLVIGDHTTDNGSNNTLEGDPPASNVQSRRAGRADQSFRQTFQSGSMTTTNGSGIILMNGKTIMGNLSTRVGGGEHVAVSALDGTTTYYDSMDQLPAFVQGNVVVGGRRPPPAAPVVPQPAIAIEYPEAPRQPEATTEAADKMCSICMDREKCTVAIPCGCTYSCVTCARESKPTTCALCRTPLKGIYKVFGQ